LSISLDGIGSVNDWYRWPSNFGQIVENMKVYDKWFDRQKRVHCVINAVNVLYLEEYISFMETNFPTWIFEWDWITWPQWQQLSVLPSTVKTQLITQFSNKGHPYDTTIDRLLDNNSLGWTDFKNNVTQLSSDRDLDFLLMVPKLSEVWNEE
jgi:sulfatase maturation enzyme AslB (radical SAM superfamily)